VPPQFSTRNETTHSIELEYRSKRAGFAPMVIGLLKGLCQRFELTDYTVSHIIQKDDQNDCDVFKIEWK
jgi:hypothetical protein